MGVSAGVEPELLMEGELEKRSEHLFQLWGRRWCQLTRDSLRLSPRRARARARAKELPLRDISSVECVERGGRFTYFTIVTTDSKETDFRCAADSSWSAAITLALIDSKNRRAVQGFQLQHSGQPERPGRAP
ncbi:pleckstrin homology-like domain family A member 2 [Callorhinchus milii]|nr:pleckstrin homology-like domain family A member 2 [Callorhinchus milii]